MTMATKNEICSEYVSRYLKASKEEKGVILGIVCAVTHLHRKAAIRKFRDMQMRTVLRPKKKPGPRVLYTPDVTAALKDIWITGNEVCGELLHPVVGEYIDILIRDKMWRHGPVTTAKLRRMSEGTMKRRIGGFFRIRRGSKGISATKPSALKQLIPVFHGPWEDKPPGWGQIDTVVHCGSTLIGDMVYTLNYTDAATMLVIPHAQWNSCTSCSLRT